MRIPTGTGVIVIPTSKRTEYFTEKIWDSFYSGSIPIYYGHESFDKYGFGKQFIPLTVGNDSYIRVQDFNYNMSALAEYLKQIDNSEELQESFQQWRKGPILPGLN